MHTLADNYPPAKAFIDESSLDKFEALAYKFFKLHTGRIEVVVNKMLTRTYFPIQPVCSHISKDSKERLLTTPSRDSPANKIIDAL